MELHDTLSICSWNRGGTPKLKLLITSYHTINAPLQFNVREETIGFTTYKEESKRINRAQLLSTTGI
jgi:hypothetical protein